MASVTEDKNVEWLNRTRNHVSGANARSFDLVAAKAEGTRLWDVNGVKYLDFTMGIAVNNIGHCHPKVVAAAKAQIDKLIHCSMVTSHEGLVRLSEKLAEITPGDLHTSLLNNSGGEAIDAAIKLARFVTGRPNIVAFTGSFHGRTLLGTALTSSKSWYRDGYEPLPSGIHFVHFPFCYRCPVGQTPGKCELECFDLIERCFNHMVKPESVAAVIIEPVLGEGGYVIPGSSYTKAPSYMKRLRDICSRHGIMLICDEVQTGFGRTGRWFACENYEIEPDILVMGKGIASGFPMAGIIARKEVMEKWKPGKHGSTYGGNPVACAAALASINVIEEENLLENARKMGAYMMDRLAHMQKRFAFIGDIRGLGLMIAAEFVDETGAPDGARLSRLVAECFNRKLLLLDCGTRDHAIRFLPPLNVTRAEIDEAMGILEEALESVK